MKKETTTTETKKTTANSTEAKAEENANNVRKTNEKLMQELQEQIAAQQEKTNTMNTLFAFRERFMNLQVELKRFISFAKNAKDNKDFEQTKHRIFFTQKDDYNRDEKAFSIADPELIHEFLLMLEQKTKSKVEQINTNILSMTN